MYKFSFIFIYNNSPFLVPFMDNIYNFSTLSAISSSANKRFEIMISPIRLFWFTSDIRSLISAYLFINTLETLANTIRNNSNIKGINIDNKEIKISLLADDITLNFLNLDSVKNSLTVLKIFSNSAGLNINFDKTKENILET